MAIYDLYESECSDVRRSTTGEPKIHMLTGKGEGCQYHTTGDPDAAGIILWESVDVESGYKDADGILIEYVIDEYQVRQQDYQWAVTTRRKLILQAGDFIKFHPKYEQPEELSVISFEKNSDKSLSIELGSRQPDFSDAWEASQDISNGYAANYLLESHVSISATAADFYINDPAHPTAPIGELTFAVPADVKNADLLARITLDLSIELKTDKLLTVGCCAVELKTDETYRQYGNIIGWSPGVDIAEIDITDWITANASNVITVGVYMADEYSAAHAAYTDHPVLTANGTMKFWKRRAV